MKYHIGREGRQLGQFSLSELQSGLAKGEFLPDDLAWREGMADWIPLQNLPEIESGLIADTQHSGEDTLPPAAGPTQFESPAQSFGTSDSTGPTDEPDYSGPAWENPQEGSIFNRAWLTIRSIVSKPAYFFQTMRTEGGLGQPLLFYIAIGWLALTINTVLELPLQLLMNASQGEALATFVTPIILAIFAPAFIAIGVFFSTGLTHLCLMMIGGANRPFEATFRVNCYAYGGVMPVAVVPFCGSFIAGIWGLVLEIIGVAEAHQISTGKAALAVLLPTLLCCGLIGGAVLTTVGFALFSLN